MKSRLLLCALLLSITLSTFAQGNLFSSITIHGDITSDEQSCFHAYTEDSIKLTNLIKLIVREVHAGNIYAHDGDRTLSVGEFDSLQHMLSVFDTIRSEDPAKAGAERVAVMERKVMHFDRVRFETDIAYDPVNHRFNEVLEEMAFVYRVFGEQGEYLGNSVLFYVRSDGR
jgi:hypothetical protein